MKKIIAAALIAAFPGSAFAAKAMEPITNQTVQSIGVADSDNDIVPLHANGSGELLVSGSLSGGTPPSSFTSLQAASTGSIKGSSGVVFSASASNGTGAQRYLLLHNKASAPIATDVPTLSFILGSGRQSIIGTDFFTTSGVTFSTGIGFCVSDNDVICNPVSATDASVFVNYQ